jgi:integrase
VAGQIVPRGKRTFLVRVYLGRDANGKREYHSQTVRGSKKDAQSVLNKLLHDKDMGTLIEPARMSLDEYLDHWLETSVKPRVREGTHQEYAATLRRNVRPILGAKKLGSIKPVDIQAVYTDMHKRGLTDSVRFTNTVLKDALKQAVKWQMLSQNPADFVDLPKVSRPKVQALTQEESQRFLEVAKSKRWYCFFSLLLSTGLRPSEALGLYWTDLNLAKGTLTVRRGLRRLKGKWVFEEPKSPSARRTLPLPASLVSLLSAHMEEQRELGFDGPLVFTSPRFC